MVTAVAEKIDFEALAVPVKATSRKEAIALTRAGQNAVHEHMTDARIYRAAAGLIEGHRAGRKTDIEAYGYPFDVLESVEQQLQDIGASQYVSDQILGALLTYIRNLGSDFSREAKAKPLYARIAVVNQAPDDLPECEQTQATMIDGVRKVGGEAARVNVQSTVFGTKSTTSQGVDLGTLFASKTDGLFVFFGSPSNEAIKGFDSVDNALVNLMQGMVGGGASAAVIEDIKEAIKNGEATPEMLKLIDNLATLQQLSEAALTPGALENPQAQIAQVVADITAQIQTGMENGTIPPALVEGSVAVLTAMAHNDVVSAIITPEAVQQIVADNDNNTLDQQIAALGDALTELAGMEQIDADTRVIIEQKIEQLQTGDMEAADVQVAISEISEVVADLPAAEGIAAQVSLIEAQVADVAQTIAPDLPIMDRLPVLAQEGAADVLAVIEALQQADAPLPEALAEIIQKLDGKPVTVEQVAEALKGQGEMAGDVQAIILALADPAVQQALPQETLNAVNEFAAKQPDLIEAVATVAVVQNLQQALTTIEPGSPEAAQIEQVVSDLKDGTRTIKTIEMQTLAPVIAQLQGTPAASVVQQAAQVVTNTQTPPVTLNNNTLAAVAAVAQAPGLDEATRQELTDLVQKGDAKAIADFIEQNPVIVQSAPPEVQTVLEQVADAAKIDTPVTSAPVSADPVTSASVPDAAAQIPTVDTAMPEVPAAPEGIPSVAPAAAKPQGNGQPNPAQPTAPQKAAVAAGVEGQKAAPAQPAITTPPARNDNGPAGEPRAFANSPADVAPRIIPQTVTGLNSADLADIKTDFTGCAGGCGPCTACNTNTNESKAPAAEPVTVGISSFAAPSSGGYGSAGGGFAAVPASVTGLEGLDTSGINTEFNGCADGCGTCTACATDINVGNQERAATAAAPARHMQ